MLNRGDSMGRHDCIWNTAKGGVKIQSINPFLSLGVWGLSEK
jgi:hypothetical protein